MLSVWLSPFLGILNLIGPDRVRGFNYKWGWNQITLNLNDQKRLKNKKTMRQKSGQIKKVENWQNQNDEDPKERLLVRMNEIETGKNPLQLLWFMSFDFD